MKVIVFHDFLLERGGGEKSLLYLSKIKEIDLTIFTSFYLPQATYPELSKIKILSLDKFLSKIAFLNRFFKVLISILFFSWILRNFSKRFEIYDLALFTGFYSVFGTRYVRIPKIYYAHQEGLFGILLRKNFRKIFWKILFYFAKPLIQAEKKAIRSMKKIIVNSKYIGNIFQSHGIAYEETIYPPVEVRKFRNSKENDYFLFVGRLFPQKNIDIILKVFSKIPEEKLVIVGDGPLRKLVKMYAKSFNNIEYLGTLSERKLIDVYSKCKAVIYLTENEPFGIVAVEANASGKPVIVSEEGGVREIIKDRVTGIIIKKPYESNLEKVIREFSRFRFDPVVCKKNARRFDIKIFKEKMIKAFKEVAKR